MYDIIKNIIDHIWLSGQTASGDQQYIYYIAGAVICIVLAITYDSVVRLFSNVFRR